MPKQVAKSKTRKGALKAINNFFMAGGFWYRFNICRRILFSPFPFGYNEIFNYYNFNRDQFK